MEKVKKKTSRKGEKNPIPVPDPFDKELLEFRQLLEEDSMTKTKNILNRNRNCRMDKKVINIEERDKKRSRVLSLWDSLRSKEKEAILPSNTHDYFKDAEISSKLDPIFQTLALADLNTTGSESPSQKSPSNSNDDKTIEIESVPISPDAKAHADAEMEDNTAVLTPSRDYAISAKKYRASINPRALSRTHEKKDQINMTPICQTILNQKKEYAPLKVPWEDLMKMIQTDGPTPASLTTNPGPGLFSSNAVAETVAESLLIDLDADDDKCNIALGIPHQDLTSENPHEINRENWFSSSIYNSDEYSEPPETTTQHAKIFSRVDLQTTVLHSHEKPEEEQLASTFGTGKLMVDELDRMRAKYSKERKRKQKQKANSKFIIDGNETCDSKESSTSVSSWNSMDAMVNGYWHRKEITMLEQSMRGRGLGGMSNLRHTHLYKPQRSKLMMERFGDRFHRPGQNSSKPKDGFVTRAKDTLSRWFRKKAEKAEKSKSMERVSKVKFSESIIEISDTPKNGAMEPVVESEPEKPALMSNSDTEETPKSVTIESIVESELEKPDVPLYDSDPEAATVSPIEKPIPAGETDEISISTRHSSLLHLHYGHYLLNNRNYKY